MKKYHYFQIIRAGRKIQMGKVLETLENVRNELQRERAYFDIEVNKSGQALVTISGFSKYGRTKTGEK